MLQHRAAVKPGGGAPNHNREGDRQSLWSALSVRLGRELHHKTRMPILITKLWYRHDLWHLPPQCLSYTEIHRQPLRRTFIDTYIRLCQRIAHCGAQFPRLRNRQRPAPGRDRPVAIRQDRFHHRADPSPVAIARRLGCERRSHLPGLSRPRGEPADQEFPATAARRHDRAL